VNPHPKYTASEAVDRARRLVGAGTYKLGALDSDADRLVFDCTSFCMRYAYGIEGHRPGYNRGWGVDWCTGATPTVIDDVNSNSAIEDAFHAMDLFRLVAGQPSIGDIIAAPTIRLPASGAGPWIGHAMIVVGTSRARGQWDPCHPKWDLLDTLECHGPDGTHPAIRTNTGVWFDERAATWPKPQHRPWLLRVIA
jgi:hypothetical protein